jgi:hypothetical protein
MGSNENDRESWRVGDAGPRDRVTRALQQTFVAIAAMAFFAIAPCDAFGQALQPVEPIVDCVKVERANGVWWIAYFGYRNPNNQPVTLQAGTAANFFLPTPPDRGQPSVFLPGEHHHVFAVLIPANSQLAWTLGGLPSQGSLRVSTSTAPTCGSYNFFKGDWVAGDGYSDGDIVTHNRMFYECRPVPTHPVNPPTLGDQTTPPDQNAEWTRIESPFDPIDLKAPPPQPGPAGPEGPQGPQGPPGPPGSQNTFPSSQTYTIPATGSLKIFDPNVTPNSLVFVQYVGGGPMPQVNDILNGEFRVSGPANRRVRYVVFN